MHLPGPGYNGLFWTGSWQQPIAYTLLDKVFGYYGIGAYNETGYEQNPECSNDYNAQPLASRASLMAQGLPIVSLGKQGGTPIPIVIDPVFFTEFCDDSDHSHDPTQQENTLHESVWATFVRNWSDPQSRWTLVSPMDRGAVDPGPSNPTTLQEPMGAINIVSPQTCGPFILRVVDTGATCVSPPPAGGNPGVKVVLHHNGHDIFEGYTGRDGTLPIYGAVPGDVIEAINPTGQDSGKAAISACQTSVLAICNAGNFTKPQPLPPDPHASQDSVDLHFHLPGGLDPVQTHTYDTAFASGDSTSDSTNNATNTPAAAPTVLVSQDGGAQQPVTLTYNPSTQNYSGTFIYTTTIATDFSVDVKATDPTSPTNTSTNLYRMVLAQYHTGGPHELVQLPTSRAPSTPPTSWDIFPPDNFVGLIVGPSTLPDGTGVVAAESSLTGLAPAPAPNPSSFMAVGGPYNINGEHPINITATLSLAYQSEYYCGLQEGGAGIYRYTGSGWDLLPTTMNFSGNHAFASITQWGTYAVFAQPNATATFSDVQSGSTYHDYIEWMACHGVASGYSDGTFRPNNNSTRGQISKMVVLAYNWDQEPPANGGHSFTDVPVGSTFFTYVEAAYRMGVFSGYPCGGTGQPCDSQHRPYFRPSANVTRSILAICPRVTLIVSRNARNVPSISSESLRYSDITILTIQVQVEKHIGKAPYFEAGDPLYCIWPSGEDVLY